MSWADIVNSSFEGAAALFILNNCRILYRDKILRGISILSTVFFTLWGGWNIYYYPSLNQWASFWGGIVVTCVNVWYVGMMVYYNKKEQDELTAEYHKGSRARLEHLIEQIMEK